MSRSHARRRPQKPTASRVLTSYWTWLAAGVALIAIALLVSALTQTQPETAAQAAAASGRAASGSIAPNLLPSLDAALEDSAGQVRLVNFWATWCPPCRAELPDLVAYAGDYAGQGFQFIGVNEQESAAQVSAFLAQSGLDFPIVLDGDGSQMAPFGVTGLPSSFLIGPDGTIVQRWTGMINRATLEQVVTPLLVE